MKWEDPMKKILFSLALTGVLFGTTSVFAAGTAYCIRVYCIKDTKAKIKNEAGHGAFFSAIFDSAANTYYLSSSTFNKLRDLKSCKPYSSPGTALDKLYGTNAATLESLTTWVVVKPAPLGINVADDSQCESLEK